jgi:hypothetical protein
MEGTHTQDNDDPFQPLSLHAEQLLTKIQEQQSPKNDGSAQSDSDDKKKQQEIADAVRQRLRDIDRFEQRYRGRKGRE